MSKETVLFVDDEESILKALKRELSAWAKGQQVELLFRSSAERALEVIEQQGKDIAVVVSDLKMPAVGGTELLTEVKSRRPEIKTIILSGYSDTGQMINAIESGIAAFILKPWESDKLVNQVEKALNGYRLQKKYNEYVHMLNEELRWAGELQKKLLEAEIPYSDKIDFTVTYEPLPNLHCGGDYYDIIPFDKDRYIILIGDVAGHGVKAAFITTMLKTMIYRGYIRRRVGKEFSPAGFLGWLNSQVCDQLQDFPDMLVTFFALLIDLPRRKLVYSNAGHFPFFLIHQDGSSTKCGVEGAGMGFEANLHYTEEEQELKPQDTAVFFTDGLLEYPG
ncbi:MAG: fused response regulator/phosphatase, partial [Spirochaetia bacterium]|nr:fused response regulator/phosphatase [Spirochaetia bacterium]